MQIIVAKIYRLQEGFLHISRPHNNNMKFSLYFMIILERSLVPQNLQNIASYVSILNWATWC